MTSFNSSVNIVAIFCVSRYDICIRFRDILVDVDVALLHMCNMLIGNFAGQLRRSLTLHP